VVPELREITTGRSAAGGGPARRSGSTSPAKRLVSQRFAREISMTTDLTSRTCLVTGASRGLGARISQVFWDSGASLLLVARSRSALEETLARLPARAGQRATALASDLADPAAAARIVSFARSSFGRLDVLVNDAAMAGPIGPAHMNDAAAWREAIQVNLLSPVELCRLCVPWMAEGGRGKIVNLSGGGATGPRPSFSAYATAKAGLVRFSETLAEETRGLSIDVNCVAPGVMKTSLLMEATRAGAAAAGVREVEIASRPGDDSALDRAAALCAFLASPASDGITGKLISAVWDPWEELPSHLDELRESDIYTLRRIVPADRGAGWGKKP
jgi:3-oxoacyl-[acyl-carrier protein] reductase